MQRPEHFDSADLDSIVELLESPGWDLFVGRVNAEIERKRDWLERGGDPAVTRGELAGLRLALSIPESLKTEIRAQL